MTEISLIIDIKKPTEQQVIFDYKINMIQVTYYYYEVMCCFYNRYLTANLSSLMLEFIFTYEI